MERKFVGKYRRISLTDTRHRKKIKIKIILPILIVAWCDDINDKGRLGGERAWTPKRLAPFNFFLSYSGFDRNNWLFSPLLQIASSRQEYQKPWSYKNPIIYNFLQSLFVISFTLNNLSSCLTLATTKPVRTVGMSLYFLHSLQTGLISSTCLASYPGCRYLHLGKPNKTKRNTAIEKQNVETWSNVAIIYRYDYEPELDYEEPQPEDYINPDDAEHGEAYDEAAEDAQSHAVNGDRIVVSGDPNANSGGRVVEQKGKKIPNEERTTTPYMTKYERARVLGTRALQIR
jgi:hypothetical protein